MQTLLKYAFTFLFSLTLSAAFLYANNLADDLKEGRDFITLNKPLNVPKNTIVELFNVGCPYCASINKILPNLFSLLPNEVVFMPYHIITSAPFSTQASEVLAVSLSLDKAQNLSPKSSNSHFKRVLDSYFDANFQQRKRFNNAESFIAHGLSVLNISKEVFDSTLKEPYTQMLLKEWKDSARYANIQGVPSFIINGKYLILAQGLKSEEDFIYKVDYLLERD
ncbi:thiol:disulfide interchange protein DsbA/DsbL [Helicobacter sp.]|uniref:thiol:disulfide interchange protein DsbA/DsbL n=1 Tax=Helicobacter sp. TaxID=218 RepID=UPI0025BF6D84|nr:thiol:disulfide interchange protein DsbA/DsbL [Helicobacter sp.]MCI5969294.1 thiol:disulfide interchange protein DsbA/DsbL [Helicobacter sp.]MDY2585548.1 thiol:disulfide interchange protein DsbA/DsbL [Helicobacter sp.]